MNVMMVEEGEAAFFFVCQALEALGAKIIRSPSLDEDKVLIHKIEVVLHLWSEFTADVETVQIRNLKDAAPDLVVGVFAHAQDVPHLRRLFKRDLVADVRALDEPNAARTAQALIHEVRARQPAPVAA